MMKNGTKLNIRFRHTLSNLVTSGSRITFCFKCYMFNEIAWRNTTTQFNWAYKIYIYCSISTKLDIRGYTASFERLHSRRAIYPGNGHSVVIKPPNKCMGVREKYAGIAICITPLLSIHFVWFQNVNIYIYISIYINKNWF